MLLIVYTTTWEIQSSNAMCLFLLSCFTSSASKLVLKFLFSAQLVQTLSQVDLLFSVFWFSKSSFTSWISWFQNLEIFPPFLRNWCNEMIWWFWVTIVTVIFTCRYFKLSWNTSALSQSNGRNFSGSSIITVIIIIIVVYNYYCCCFHHHLDYSLAHKKEINFCCVNFIKKRKRLQPRHSRMNTTIQLETRKADVSSSSSSSIHSWSSHCNHSH